MEEMPTIPGPSRTERNLNAAKRAQADDSWAAERLAAQEAAAKEAASSEQTAGAIDSAQAEKAQAKMEAAAELQRLGEQVALGKVRLAADRARLNELSAWMKGDEAGNDAVQTGKNVAEMRALQTSIPQFEVTLFDNEEKLKRLEAQYRTRFPETLN